MRTSVILLAVVGISQAMAGVLASASEPAQVKSIGTIVREDPRLDRLVAPGTEIEVLAQGFDWTEGPVWVPKGKYLLFSDIPRNTIYRWKEGEGISIFLRPASYTGEVPWGKEPGTNGLLLDSQGRLVMCEHGNRRVSKLVREQDAIKETLVSHYQGKRLNSPNDAVFMSNGDLYFTDPPYGLPKREEDPNRDLDFCGVFRLSKSGGGDPAYEGNDASQRNWPGAGREDTLRGAIRSEGSPLDGVSRQERRHARRGARLLRRHAMGRQTQRVARRHDHRQAREHFRYRSRWGLRFSARRYTARAFGHQTGHGQLHVRR